MRTISSNFLKSLWLFLLAAVLLAGQLVRIPLGFGRATLTGTDLIIFLVVLAALGYFAYRKQIKLNSGTVFLVAFFVIALIAMLIAFFRYPFAEVLEGSLYFVRWSAIVLGSLFIAEIFSKDSKKIFFSIFLMATALALLGFLQLVFYPNLVDLAEEGWDPHMGRLVATWLDPNFLGGFFTFVSALAFGFYTKAQGKSKIALLFLIILLFSATVLTFSRSAYFAFAISFVCIGILKARKFLAIGLLVAIFTIMFLPRMQERLWGAFEIDETAQARIQSWAKVKEIISQNWLTGVGVNLLPYELLRRGDIENVYIHSSAGSDSSLANIWAMTGIFGLILTAFFILLVLKKSWNLSKERDPLKSGFGLGFFAGTLGLLFHSNFVNSLFYPPIMIVFWITTGLLLKYSLEESQSKKI